MLNSVQNKMFCYAILFLLFAELMIQDLNFLLANFFGLTNTSLFTLFYYVAVLLYTIYLTISTLNLDVVMKRLVLYIAILLLFGLSIFFYPKTIQYYDLSMAIVFAFYLPVCVFVISRINDFTPLLILARPFYIIAVIMSALIIFVLKHETFGNYMEFSYAFLPFVLFAYCDIEKTKKLSTKVFFIISLLTIIFHGARASVFFCLLFIFAHQFIFKRKENSTKKMIIGSLLLICFITCVLFKDQLESLLIAFANASNSRFIYKFLNNELFISLGRERLFTTIRNEIDCMGFNVYGPFADRQFLGIYCHNIIYEMLISFGWFFAFAIFIFFIWLSIVIFFNKTNVENKLIYMFFIFSIFAKYFVSDSFIQSGNFYIFLFVMLTMAHNLRLQRLVL